MNAQNLITDGEMWDTTGESDLQDADRLGNIYPNDRCCPFLLYRKLTSCKVKNALRGCAKTHSLFLYKRQEKDIRTAGVKRRCVCKKEIMGKCQRDYEKTVMVCG